VVITEEDSVQYSGIRERLGELCYGSGLLRVLQRTRSWVRQDLRILAYHRVLTVQDSNAFDFDLDLVSTSADGFREQMQLLQRDFSPTALGDVIAALDAGTRLPTNAVVVTFDDGYDDNYGWRIRSCGNSACRPLFLCLPAISTVAGRSATTGWCT
jgi:hypothetical protein